MAWCILVGTNEVLFKVSHKDVEVPGTGVVISGCDDNGGCDTGGGGIGGGGGGGGVDWWDWASGCEWERSEIDTGNPGGGWDKGIWGEGGGGGVWWYIGAGKSPIFENEGGGRRVAVLDDVLLSVSTQSTSFFNLLVCLFCLFFPSESFIWINAIWRRKFLDCFNTTPHMVHSTGWSDTRCFLGVAAKK